MKIKFLGTSAGWPLPRLGCSCQICTSKDPKDTRTRTQILINDSILLDAGPDTYQHLLSKDVNNLEAILISHEHLDHILGFWDLTHIYNRRTPLNVYLTLQVLSGIRKITSTHGKNLKINVIKPNEPFTVKNVRLEYFPVTHGKTPAFGVKVKDNKIAAYIPDFNRILPSSQKVIRGCHVLIIDGSSLGKVGQSKGHISIIDGISIAKKLDAESVYFVHIGHKTATHEFLENYLRQNAGPNFHVAFDGQELLV